MSEPKPMPVDVVVHTHWDREWYLPHQTTVARLRFVMRAVVDALDTGQLHSFLFDGQTAALEDLVAQAEPALVRRVRTAIAQGRISLGPWYIAADEFLCSGESLLRNLLTGIADATAEGGLQRVGYLPDSFGHVAQMPQLLQLCGIGTAVLWRGADARQSLFDWVAPDGSRVATVFLPEGYYQHALNLPTNDARTAALTTLLDRLAARAGAARLLLTQGGDHLLPAPDMAARIVAFNAAQSRYCLQPATLAGHVEAVLKETNVEREVHHGELRSNAQAFVLPDVLSTRRTLKRLHDAAEDRLLGAIEPLLALCVPAAEWPTRALDQAWRLLLQQQAHDSICGCSVDAVHAEMAQRFAQLGQRLDGLQQHALATAGMVSLRQHAGGPDVFADDARCTLLNPWPQCMQGWQVVTVFLRGELHAGLSVSAAGAIVPCELLSATPHEEVRSPLDDFPERLVGYRYELALHLDLAGLDTLTLEVRRAPMLAPLALECVENACTRLSLDSQGQLLWHDVASARDITAALQFHHELDAGDSYNYSPPTQPQRTRQARFELIDARRIGALAEMRLRVQMLVPTALDVTRHRGSDEQVVNDGELRLRLFGDEPMVDAQLRWKNRSCDQRTRLLWPLPASTATVHTDTAFDWQRRSVQLAAWPDAPSRQEMPVVVMPTLSAVAAAPWCIAHLAMHECEVVEHHGAHHLALTLIRSVGWLSRRDLRTRGVGAGPDIATPEAQCLGEEVFHFRFGTGSADQALPQARRLRRPALLLQGHRDAWPQGVDIGNAVVQVSALRRVATDTGDAGSTLEIRVWNPTDAVQTLALDHAQWQAARADAVPVPSPLAGPIQVAPHAIMTLHQR